MDHDVIVSGAGPVGLMLAAELRLGGARVAVVERLAEADTTIKAGAINTPTAEAFDRRGLLAPFEEIQRRLFDQIAEAIRQRFPDAPGASPQRALPPRFAGHFAAMMLSAANLDESDPALQGHGPAAEVGLVPQIEVERVLEQHARSLGADLCRGTEVTGFEQDADGVAVHLADGGSLRAAWLVGCDGGRSLVRRLGGFDFPGTDPEITGHQAIVGMENAEGLGLGWQHTPTGVFVNGPTPGRILTVEFDGPPADRDAPITAAELQASIRHVSGVPITVTAVHSATRFTDNARQATAYRRGRVLLAGDAAHVHSPFGGQGLNLGIGDAVNLGWKLAAVVRGWAPEELLDTYTTERHPIGEWVLDWSRAQVALMRPDVRTRELRKVVRELVDTRPGTTYLVKRISGVWQRYDLGGGHALVGASAPDLELADGSRLADHLHDARAVLFDLTGNVGLRRAAAPYGERLRIVEAPAMGATDVTALLVRPDGFVAWAAPAPEGAPPLEEALGRWLGEPLRPAGRSSAP